jgi:MFS family permease
MLNIASVSPHPIQSGRAWVILAFSALIVVFLGGKRRAFGIFVAQLHVEYNTTSLAELNWIGDSYAALGYLSSTISSALILHCNRRFGLFQFMGAVFVLLACVTSAYVPSPHWLFLTHTVFHGIGSSLILSAVGLVVNEHFDKNHRYHILATTLVSGGSVASIVFVQIYAYMIEIHGWRTAFLLLGVLYFVVNSAAALVFKKNNALPDYKQKNKCSLGFMENVDRQKGLLLFLWFLDRITTSIVTYGVLLNLADYMRRREPTLTRSAMLTTLFAAGEATTYVIGAMVTALTQNWLKNRLKYILLFSSACLAVCLILWEFVAENRAASRILAYLAGFFLGPSITFLFPAGEEITTLPGHLAYPFTLAGMGLGMILSPTFSAFVAQAFQYHWFFMVQGMLILVKIICLVAAIGVISQMNAEEHRPVENPLDRHERITFHIKKDAEENEEEEESRRWNEPDNCMSSSQENLIRQQRA